jgi:hypothetical protein
MHTFYINALIVVSSTCFEHPSVHPQEDLHKKFYGVSFMHPYEYKQPGGWQDVLDQARPASHQSAYMDA